MSEAESGPVICPFRQLTGLPCPGCGLIRSWVAIGHGDPVVAFHEHPFGALLFALALAAIAAVSWRALRRHQPVDINAVAASRPAMALAALWLVWWAGTLLA